MIIVPSCSVEKLPMLKIEPSYHLSLKKPPLLTTINSSKIPSPKPPHYHHNHNHIFTSTMSSFVFPETNSTVLPDPSNFFSQNLLSNPLPTNSFFQNYVLKNGDQPEYFHPYLINSSNSSLTLCYPFHNSNSSFISQVFINNLTISSSNNNKPEGKHVISSYSDLGVTLDIPSSNLQCFLVKGSPFVTVSVTQPTSLSITTIHAILSFSSNDSLTKFTFQLNNGQTWLLYSSSPINLTHTLSEISSSPFSGVIRIALLPDSAAKHEAVLDKFSTSYPVSGEAIVGEPFRVRYNWNKKGSGDLLMLAHPLHLRLLDNSNNNDDNVTVLDDFKYNSIDGELVGVVGDSWILQTDPVFVTWHSSNGVRPDSYDEIVSALSKDVESLDSSSTLLQTSSYFYGKLIARAARLALIAEEVYSFDVIAKVRNFLKETIEPWLEGTFNGNGFLHDKKWGGIVTKSGSTDSGADFGFGIYNDHHYHLGYFIYAIATLVKIDPAWGSKYRSQAYSLVSDFMNFDIKSDPNYTRLRCFDPYTLHSWAGGLTEFADGRNQESTSEAVSAYYSAALLGMAYGDASLVAVGSTLTALEILGTQTWWHVKEGSGIYEDEFTKENRVMGVLWSNKRDSGLWFAPAEWKECRLGIQVLPLLPITEALFSDVGYGKELVEWTLPALKRDGVGEGWKGFVYGLQGVYDNEGALENVRNLRGFDGGNSLTNLLWWIHSRG